MGRLKTTSHEDRQRALVLIPARNEAAHIGPVVSGCVAAGFSVWVLDDGSRDCTGEIAAECGARVLRHAAGGKTAILKWALPQVPQETEWIIFMDGDGQHHPADLGRFWARREHADLILGNRWADASQMPWIRRLVNRGMTWLINTLSGGCAPDTQCGFRMIRRELLRGWLPSGRHYEFETELYLHALHRGAVIDSLPLRALYGTEKSKIFWPRDAWRFVRCLLVRG